MTEEKIHLVIKVPSGEMKPYKMVKNLKKMIDTVTKDYSYKDTYISEEDKILNFVFVFQFYDKKVYEQVNQMFTKISSMLPPTK